MVERGAQRPSYAACSDTFWEKLQDQINPFAPTLRRIARRAAKEMLAFSRQRKERRP